jgi:hypothetical protein
MPPTERELIELQETVERIRRLAQELKEEREADEQG